MTVMHPFMPFITEEIWSKIKSKEEFPLIISDWPQSNKVNKSIINDFESLTGLISSIRKYRKEKSISFKENLTLFSKVSLDKKGDAILLKLANTEITNDFSKKLENSSSFIVGSNEFHFNNKTNVKEDFSKIQQDLDYNLGFLKSIQAKLSNKRFVDNAPQNVLNNELKKEKDTLSKIEILKNKLNK